MKIVKIFEKTLISSLLSWIPNDKEVEKAKELLFFFPFLNFSNDEGSIVKIGENLIKDHSLVTMSYYAYCFKALYGTEAFSETELEGVDLTMHIEGNEAFMALETLYHFHGNSFLKETLTQSFPNHSYKEIFEGLFYQLQK